MCKSSCQVRHFFRNCTAKSSAKSNGDNYAESAISLQFASGSNHLLGVVEAVPGLHTARKFVVVRDL